jgi:hypothetical protein
MDFIENAFEPMNPILISLKKKIEDKKLSFHPYLVTSAIQVEVERQLKTLIENTFRDMSVEQLGACSLEVTKYAESEESRYQLYISSHDKTSTLDGVLKSDTIDLAKAKKPVVKKK